MYKARVENAGIQMYSIGYNNSGYVMSLQSHLCT